MSTFGVVDLFGLSAPTAGYVNESRQSKSVEVDTIPNQAGVTTCVGVKPLVTIEITNSGRGDAGVGSMAAAELTALDTPQIYSRSRKEANSSFPDFETRAKAYDTYVAATPGAGPVAPTYGTPPAGCPVLGLTSVGFAGVTNFEIDEVLEEAEPVLDPDGTFDHQHFYNPSYTFTVRGMGDFPAALVIGSSGDLEDTVPEFATGVTIITNTNELQKIGDPEWDISGQHWDGAA